MKRLFVWTGFLVATQIALVGCRATAETEQALETARLCLESRKGVVPITVELAVTPSQRERGLMGRESLPADHGMLFVYKQPRAADATFWMYRTFIPLDIAYIDQTGEIKAIRKMLPCTADNPSRCPTYPAGAEHVWALEMNQGFFREKQVLVGDRVIQIASDEICPVQLPEAA
ncbi:DUF192 domain-containing protein [Marinobacter bohaiensis]|uniref:DUF192 domain-containing protein n=1 Tax=Marinobacter bohaiensis TaxID=2201898 RepID=UPI000DAC679E|nr:DUF192 domain-containing protein [Marinobacter bohaiensis]